MQLYYVVNVVAAVAATASSFAIVVVGAAVCAGLGSLTPLRVCKTLEPREPIQSKSVSVTMSECVCVFLFVDVVV